LLLSLHHSRLENYMQNKYKWNQNTFCNIDWDLHENVQQKCYHQFITKFIHYWLPVADHPAQANENHQCFWCNNTIEDQQHWYKCTSTDAINTRNHQKEFTIQFLNRTKLHPSLHHLIIDLMYSDKLTSTQPLQKAYFQQNQIGWDQLLRGRISVEWIKYQNKLTNREDGETTWITIIEHIYTTLHELWLDRNNELHSKATTLVQRRLESIIIPKLTRIYNLQSLVPVQDRQIFELPLEEMIKLNPSYLQRWIERHEFESSKRENNRLKINNTTITNFFTKLTPSKKKNHQYCDLGKLDETIL
jgi:hypothetical protein